MAKLYLTLTTHIPTFNGNNYDYLNSSLIDGLDLQDIIEKGYTAPKEGASIPTEMQGPCNPVSTLGNDISENHWSEDR